ncbi:MAG: flagellar protein FlaG [Steroidobacteraceae bacterium]|jgi:flagellar protein FlaG|nr:flagellar protein FlaG [Steroidobacteraceae bacterium]
MAQGSAAPSAEPPRVRDGGALPPGGKAVPPAPDLSKVVEAIERFIRDSARSVSFSYDDAAGRSVIVVRDGSTGEVLRQFPLEEALAVARRLADSAGAGGLLDLRA